jgi:CheY-like chemotaxis protein
MGRPPGPPPPVLSSNVDMDMRTMTTDTTSELIPHDDQWRPVAYVTMHDPAARARIMSVLERAGWAVIPQPTGFHLIQAISGVIEGHLSWLRPGLIVVDARSRGCSGITIAAGLRDLAITIPIVLVAADGEALPVSTDHSLRVVDARSAEAVVGELAAFGIVGGIAPSPSPELRQAG